MKLKVFPVGEGESFEVEVTKVITQGVNNYLIKHKQYRAFQYDCYNRPNHYGKEYAQTLTFHGFLIGKGKNSHLECYIKIIY